MDLLAGVSVELEPGLYPVSMRFDYTLPLRSFYSINPAIIPDIATKTANQVDALVELRGNTLILVRCLTPAFDEYDGFDPRASIWDLQVTRAIVSVPSDKEARDIAGRGIAATKRATVPHNLWLRTDREGMVDLLIEFTDPVTLSVTGSGSSWMIWATVPDGSLTTGYIVDFTTPIPTIAGINRDEYTIYRVTETRRDRHPFVGIEKLTVYLQVVDGV